MDAQVFLVLFISYFLIGLFIGIATTLEYRELATYLKIGMAVGVALFWPLRVAAWAIERLRRN